jgi:FkbM family methyltransferase
VSVTKRLKTNFDDIRRYGPQFLLRHVPRFTGAETALVRIGGQNIHLRAGESDTAAVRGVFGSQQYNIAQVIPGLESRIARREDEIVATGKVPVIVDAGANIGAAALWFRQKYPRSSVVAIEPEPGNFSVLMKNASADDRIVPHNAAIGSEEGFVAVKNGGMGWAAQVERSNDGFPIITMQQAFSSIPNGAPFMAKVDIEGFEQELFSKNTDWLADVFVVHIEPHDWMMPGKGTSLSFQKAMAKYDFELFIAGEVLTYVRH